MRVAFALLVLGIFVMATLTSGGLFLYQMGLFK